MILCECVSSRLGVCEQNTCLSAAFVVGMRLCLNFFPVLIRVSTIKYRRGTLGNEVLAILSDSLLFRLG